MKPTTISVEDHEAELAQMRVSSGRAVALSEVRAQQALARAEAAEAQLANLSAPLVEVLQRTAKIHTVEVTDQDAPDKLLRVIAVVDMSPGSLIAPFHDHAAVLGLCMQRLVRGAMQLTVTSPQPPSPQS